MTDNLQHAYFPSFSERRRPMNKILPPGTGSGKNWFTKAIWFFLIVTVLSAGGYVNQLSNVPSFFMIRAAWGAAPVYRWLGYHRVAP